MHSISLSTKTLSIAECIFVDKRLRPQYNPQAMKEGTIFARARDHLDMAEIDLSETFPKPPEFFIALACLAQAEAAFALTQSQRLLAETQVEANRLKRIELGIVQPGDLTDQHFSGVAPSIPEEQARMQERDAYDSPAR